MRTRYQNKSKDEKRVWVARRDSEKVKRADRERYYRDWKKRRALSDQYQRDHPEKVAKANREWRERNPEKRRAHSAVSNAIRSGRLKRLPCEVCGEKAHAHHEDYDKPLDVIWRCPLHHGQLHRKV